MEACGSRHQQVFHARFVKHAYAPNTHDTRTVFIVDDGAIRYDLETRHRGVAGGWVTILPPQVVHEHRFEPMRPGGAGRTLPCVTRAFVRCFSRTVAIALHRSLVARRIDDARRRLLEGEPVAQVAMGAGFHDQARLARHFKRHVGTTPAHNASTNT